MMDRFFDDWFIVEPEITAASASWALQRIMQAMGLILDKKKKSCLPRSVWCALGVLFDMQLHSHRKLLVKAKPKRLSMPLSRSQKFVPGTASGPRTQLAFLAKWIS